MIHNLRKCCEIWNWLLALCTFEMPYQHFAVPGMEDAFQRLSRLVRRGSENKVISQERLYQKLIKATAITFPNVGQRSITVDRMEETSGPARALATEGVVAPLHAGKLAKGAYTPNPQQHWLKKPVGNHKTCKNSAFSQQVGLEECLLQSELAAQGCRAGHLAAQQAVEHGYFTDLRFVQKSGACGLVETVAEIAVDLEEPYVLASESRGTIWLVVCSLGRCLLGWPLRLVSEEEAFFQPMLHMTQGELERIIITDPFSTQEVANVPVEVRCVSEQVDNMN